MFLSVFAMTAWTSADARSADPNPAALTSVASTTPTPSDSTDASVLKWTRLYCTSDNESHFETVSSALGQTNFAPPASPIFIGGGGPANKIVFGGFEANWGAGDVQSGKTHPTPKVQWITVLAGSMVVSTTDGDSRRIGPGDIVHLEDVAPCRGHITLNLAAGATFLEFVQ